MYEPLKPAEWLQLPLLTGGYDQVRVELTGYLTGGSDQFELNVVVTEVATSNWISACVPTLVLALRDEVGSAQRIIDLVRDLWQLLQPFPTG